MERRPSLVALDKKQLKELAEINIEAKSQLMKRNKELEEELERIKKDYEKLKIKQQSFTPFEDFQYDMVIDMENISDLKNGCKVIIHGNNHKTFAKKNTCVVGVLGNYNKGKSYLLSRLCKKNFAQGFSVKTNGLSIKFPENLNGITALDSAGFETPLQIVKLIQKKNTEQISERLREFESLIKDDQEVKSEMGVFVKLFREDNITISQEKLNNFAKFITNYETITDTQLTEVSNFINTIKNKNYEDLSDSVLTDIATRITNINNSSWYISDNQLKESCCERQHTEEFLQKFIIDNSDIIIVVVGVLTHSDQKLITKIKNFGKNKELIVLHNLFQFSTKEEVKKHIELLKNVFPIEESTYTEIDENMDPEVYNKSYFIQDKECDSKILHMIMAKEHEESGDYYNLTTLEFLSKHLISKHKTNEFDPIDKFIKYINLYSVKTFEEKINVEYDEERQLFFTKDKIIMKKIYIDPIGFSVSQNNSSNYNLYLSDEEFGFSIECPSACADEKSLENGECRIDYEKTHDQFVFSIYVRKKDVSLNFNNSNKITENIISKDYFIQFGVHWSMLPGLECYEPEVIFNEGVLNVKYKLIRKKSKPKPKINK